MIAKRSEVQQRITDRLGRRSKDDFHVGDRVLCQDMKTMKWSIKGEVMEAREAEDGSARSFIVRTEMGRTTLRNSRHIKFQAMVPKRVSFADTADTDSGIDSDGDETAVRSAETDEAADAPRTSARLAARNGRQL